MREEDLYCTPTGQVATSLGGETVTTLNQMRVKQFQRGNVSPEQIAKLIDYRQPRDAFSVKPFGTIARDGYRIEKLVYETEPGIVIPALLFVPHGSGKHPGVLYVDGAGKSAHVQDAEALVKAGHVVLSIDARGLGETRISTFQNGSDWFRLLRGLDERHDGHHDRLTLTGQRAADISRGLDILASRSEVDAPGSTASAWKGAVCRCCTRPSSMPGCAGLRWSGDCSPTNRWSTTGSTAAFLSRWCPAR
ncbi:MAG: hypothetical protein QM757_04705 [Paludibaculum sp.]